MLLQTPQLREAVEALYRIFQHYGLRSNTEPCLCHHTSADEQHLHSRPLHKLKRKDLRDYAMDAIYTWGTGDDFKHFLPRLFELIAGDESNFVDPASLFSRLVYESWCSSHWRSWPADEQEAIADYFRAVWEAALNSNPEDPSCGGVHGWIQAIAQAEHDITPYLDRWLNATSVNAHRNLALMITENGLPHAKNPGGYWAGHRHQWQQLNAWVRLPQVHEKLTHATERWSDLPFAAELLDAAILLL